MKKILLFGLVIVVAAIATILIVRSNHTKEIVSLIVMVPEEESPLDSLPIQKLQVSLENRELAANLLVYADEAPAVFICTGNGEALYEWLPVQKYLYDKGFTSYIFSFSGFGNSTGTPTEESLYEDALAAYNQFAGVTPMAGKRIGLSHSLGGTPLLGIAGKMDPAPDKLVVHASFSSIQQLLVDLDMASDSFRWLWPDVWNNLEYARDIELPILYVHSKDDKTVPYSHSEELMEVSGDNASLLLLEEYGHNAIYKDVSDSLYAPILEFIHN